jgi:hypothetical protein
LKKLKFFVIFAIFICKLCYSFDGEVVPFYASSRAYIGMVYTKVDYAISRASFVNCGGTLITRGEKSYIVTAYHCLDKRLIPRMSKLDKYFTPRRSYVYLPPVGLRNNNMMISNWTFGSIEMFPEDGTFMSGFMPDPLLINYYIVNNIYYMNPKEWGLNYVPDLAVLEISKKVKRNNFIVEPINLDQVEMYMWGDAEGFGWAGMLVPNGDGNNKDFVENGVLKSASAIGMNPYPYSNGMYGVIHTPLVGDDGDSGSPLIVHDNLENAYLYGVASYIDGHKNIYYTNLAVPPIHYWLKNVLAGKQTPSCALGSNCNAYSLPQGSYLETCRAINWNFPYLEANCKNSKGNYVLTSRINYFSSCYTGQSAKPYPYPTISTTGSTVSNINSQLKCDVIADVPPGDYLQTCKLYYWDRTTLSATCEKRSSVGIYKINSSIMPGRCGYIRPDYRFPWISNNNGILTCGRV